MHPFLSLRDNSLNCNIEILWPFWFGSLFILMSCLGIICTHLNCIWTHRPNLNIPVFWCATACRARYMLSPVCLSVRPSVHGWISQKLLKLGSCNFHHTVAPSLWLLRDKFHPEILTGSPWEGASNKGGVGKTSYFLALCVNISKTVRDTSTVTTN